MCDDIHELNDDELDGVVGTEGHIRDHRDANVGGDVSVAVLENQLKTAATTIVSALKNLPF